MSEFIHHEMFPLAEDTASYRRLTTDYVATARFEGETVLKVDTRALTLLAEEAMRDTAHFLRSEHLAQLSRILDDPEASGNDKFVALELLKNANIAAGGVLPAPEVVLTDLVEGHGRGIGGDMTADANTGTLRAMHGNGGIPAQQTTDVPLDLGVAGVFFLVLGCNGVDVVGGGER